MTQMKIVGTGVFVGAANGLGFSGGAPIDREGSRAEARFQNCPDLGGAERRPLQALVGPQPQLHAL